MKRFLIVLAALCGLAACGEAIKSFDEVNNPSDDVALAQCRARGRDAGPDAHVAYGEYVDCTKEAGLR